MRAAGEGSPIDDLVRLAQADLGLVETIQLDHALRKLADRARRELAVTKLALLSAATTDHLLPAIRVGGLRRRLWIDVHKGGFGQYRQELLDPASALTAFAPDVIVLSLTLVDAIGRVPLAATAADADRAVDAAADAVHELWRHARERFGATVVQQSILDASEPVFGSFDRLVPASPSRLAARLNDRLADRAAAAGVLWLDVAAAAARDGLDAWFDAGQWLHAKAEIAMAAAPRFGELVARVVAAARGLSRKCLVLDLDNTLWGGVVGDDGPEGIVLGEGSASGEAHLALQRYAKALAERGVMLAVCSRNDRAIVDAVFRDHPEMVLRPADISAWAVDWRDKVTNLQAIAQALNIGLDSLVFVDDNPAERAHVMASLPMVAVPDLPDDPARFVRCIARAGYFEAVAFTDEDRHRTAHYAANAARDRLLKTSGSLGDFLRSLEMTMAFGPIGPMELERAAQLINKTNQFNTTGRRTSVDALRAFSATPGNIALQFRLSDRFGDNGLVSVMLVRRVNRDVFDIDGWVMSCRVFGRELEHEAMNVAVEAVRREAGSAVTADFLPTARNGVISRLYEDLGFVRHDDPGAAPASRWRLRLDAYEPRDTAIARLGHPHD